MLWLSTSPANRVLSCRQGESCFGRLGIPLRFWLFGTSSNFRAINFGEFRVRARTVYSWGGNMKYVRRSNGQTSVDPIAVYKRQREYIDMGEQAPPIRSHGPNCLLCSPETWTSEHEE
jgi:hypothetical protein